MTAAAARDADRYPARAVRLVVPFPPGGSTEFAAKTLADGLQKIHGQPFVIAHTLGDFGIAAMRELLAADPHTLLVGSVNTNSIAPVLFRARLGFDYWSSILPVSKISEFPSVFVTRSSEPATSVRDFLGYAASTWGRVRNGTDWIGSYADIDAVILGRAAGVDVVNVERPEGGADGLLEALVNDELDMIFLNARTAGRAIRAGRIKGLAVTGPARLAGFPDIPTMQEAGFPGIGTSHWHGLFASAGIPGEVANLLHASVVEALDMGELRAAFRDAGAWVTPSRSPAAFAAEIRAEMEQWERVRDDIALRAAE
jgi:tripartite-type tricarboxylate transporter receptor subunit TctC